MPVGVLSEYFAKIMSHLCWETGSFHLVGKVCIFEIKWINNLNQNRLWPFNKDVPVLAILWEFKNLLHQIVQETIFISVILITLYVTEWYTARSNFWCCCLAVLNKDYNTEEVTKKYM